MQSTYLIDDSFIEDVNYPCKLLLEKYKKADPFYQKIIQQSFGQHFDIPRPNHGIPHCFRVAAYIPLVAVFLKKHVKYMENDTITHIDLIDSDMIRMLQKAALFSVVGREDEQGFDPDDKHSQRICRSYRHASSDAFEESLGETENKKFWASVVLEMCNEPFYTNNINVLEERKDICFIPDRKPHIADLILHNAHRIDLFRCKDLSGVDDYRLQFLKKYSNNHPDFEKDFIQLLLFVRRALEQTGNRIRSYMLESGKIVKVDNNSPLKLFREKFLECYNNPELCREILNQIELPEYYVDYLHNVNKQNNNICDSLFLNENLSNYLKKASLIDVYENCYTLAFVMESDAGECVEIIKQLLKTDIKDKPYQQYSQEDDNKTYFVINLSIDEWDDLRKAIRDKSRILKPKDDYFFKSILPGVRNSFYSFTSELIDTSIRLEKRHGRKRNFKGDGSGVYTRNPDCRDQGYPVKKSLYTPEEKAGYTKKQAVTLAFGTYNPPPYKFNEEKKCLTGFLIERKDVLLTNENYTANNATVRRPREHFKASEAVSRYNAKVNKTLFSKDNFTSFKIKLLSNKITENNESLACLRWNCDNTAKGLIFIDTMESRLQAMQYAKSFAAQLKRAGKCALDYYIPVIFYVSSLEDNLKKDRYREYSADEYEMDCLMARYVACNKDRFINHINSNNFEFLFGLENDVIGKYIFNVRFKDHTSLMIHLLASGYVYIFRLLQEKMELSLEEALDGLEEIQYCQKMCVDVLFYILNCGDFELAEYVYSRIDYSKFDTKQAENEKSPLIAAIEKNNLIWLNRLIKHKWINLEAKDLDGLHGEDYTPLGLAIYHDRFAMVESLLDVGVENAKSRSFSDMLMQAVYYGNINILKSVYKKFNCHLLKEKELSKVIFLAIEHYHFDNANYLLDDLLDKRLTYVFCYALLTGDNVTNYIWDKYKNRLLISTDDSYRNPLYIAVNENKEEIANRLIDYYMFNAKKDQTFLIETGCRVIQSRMINEFALRRLNNLYHDDKDDVYYGLLANLLSHPDADVNVLAGREQMTPLMLFARHNRLEEISTLIAIKKINVKNTNNLQDAFEIAMENKHYEAAYLIAVVINVNFIKLAMAYFDDKTTGTLFDFDKANRARKLYKNFIIGCLKGKIASILSTDIDFKTSFMDLFYKTIHLLDLYDQFGGYDSSLMDTLFGWMNKEDLVEVICVLSKYNESLADEALKFLHDKDSSIVKTVSELILIVNVVKPNQVNRWHFKYLMIQDKLDKNQQSDLLELLLTNDVDVNQVNAAGFTPLMILVLNQYAGDVKQLLAMGKIDLHHTVMLCFEKMKNYIDPRMLYTFNRSVNSFELALATGHYGMAFQIAQFVSDDLLGLLGKYKNRFPAIEYSTFKIYVNILKRCLSVPCIRNSNQDKKIFVSEFYKHMNKLDPDSSDSILIANILDFCMDGAEIAKVLNIASKSEATMSLATFIKDNYSDKIINAAKEYLLLEDLDNPHGLLLVKCFVALADNPDLLCITKKIKFIFELMKINDDVFLNQEKKNELALALTNDLLEMDSLSDLIFIREFLSRNHAGFNVINNNGGMTLFEKCICRINNGDMPCSKVWLEILLKVNARIDSLSETDTLKCSSSNLI